MTIRTADDWWAVCDRNWEHILDIFQRVGAPMGRDEEDRWWSDSYGHPTVEHPKCLVQTMEDFKKARNGPPLVRLFNQAWIAAPDTPDIHSWPGWSDFCDLCSEEWVFNPEETDHTPEEANMIICYYPNDTRKGLVVAGPLDPCQEAALQVDEVIDAADGPTQVLVSADVAARLAPGVIDFYRREYRLHVSPALCSGYVIVLGSGPITEPA